MPSKVLLIGLDALDPATTDRLAAGGHLPMFAALSANAHRMALENYPALGAGVFWPSAATGAGPDGHGRYYSVRFDRTTYDRIDFDDDRDFAAEAVWSTLDREGRRVAVVDWPHAPVQSLERGIVMSNWFAHDAKRGPRSHPPSLARDIRTRFGADPWPRGAIAVELDGPAAVRTFVDQAVWRIGRKTDFVVEALREGDWDLFVPSYSEMHDIGHYCLHVSDPAHSDHDPTVAAAAGDPVATVMRALDTAIGRLVEAAGPRARVLILAGPGMAPMASANAAMDELTRRLDLGLEGAVRPLVGRRDVYRRRVPLAVRRRLAPLMRPLRRRSLLDEHRDRRFFAVPHNDNAGAIRFNIRGREAAGRVAPGAERDALAAMVSAELASLHDPATGDRIVERIVDLRAVFDGPRVEDLPDLMVVWSRRRPVEALASPRIGTIPVARPRRTGDHTPYGFLWICGPEVTPAADRRTRPPSIVADIVRAAVAD